MAEPVPNIAPQAPARLGALRIDDPPPGDPLDAAVARPTMGLAAELPRHRADGFDTPRPTRERVDMRNPLHAAVARPRAVPQLCGTACRDLRSEMHRFVDGADIDVPAGKGKAAEQRSRRAAELEAVGIDAEWARRFIDQANIEEPDLRHQFDCWRKAIDELKRRETQLNEEPLPVPLPGPGVSAKGFERARAASPGQLSTADATAVRRDLRALGYSTGARGASGAWDADAFEGYKDFLENAVRGGRLTAEQAHSARAADRAAVRTLLRNAARAPQADAAMRASPAQATMETTVAPEWKLVKVKRRWVRRPSGHHNKADDVERVQRALLTRGFYVDPTKMRTYDESTQHAIQLYNASYRGLHERDGGASSLTPGSTMTRSLFGSPEQTPHLIDGPRWGELQDDPTIGLVMYHTPGSYVTSWGSQRARDFMVEFARALHAVNPAAEVRANDISLREGGPHPFHSGHQVGMEVDITHADQAEGQSRADWLEGLKAELLAMRPFASRIAFIYNSNTELVTYGRSLGLNMIQIGGHRGHFHVGINGWTGELSRN